jgi:sarcosine oxidase subunit beta
VNFGNIRLQGRHPAQYPLALRSHALWEQAAALTGEDCEFEQAGHLYIAVGAAQARAAGLDSQLLDGEAAHARFPWLREAVNRHPGRRAMRRRTRGCQRPRWRGRRAPSAPW